MACELRMRCGAGRVALLVPPGMSPPAGLTCVLGLFGLFGLFSQNFVSCFMGNAVGGVNGVGGVGGVCGMNGMRNAHAVRGR